MKNITFVMGLVLMLMWGCAKTPVYKSTWRQPSFQENTGEIPWLLGMHYDTETGIMYGLSNDQDKLFVKLKIADQIIQRKIMVTGLTFWIDTLGKKKKLLGLIFPIKARPKEMAGGASSKNRYQNPYQSSLGQIETLQFNLKYKAGMESMLLINYFGNGRTDFITNKNTEGINAILRYDKDQILYYEVEIPLTKIFPNHQVFLNDTTKTFSFGFESGKLEIPTMVNQSKGERGGMKGGGMANGGRGGHRGGGGQQMDTGQIAVAQTMAEPIILWIKKARLKYQSN